MADHMSDIVHYVSSLRSTIELGKYIDGILVASTDGISRQLACLQESKLHDDEDISCDTDEIKDGKETYTSYSSDNKSKTEVDLDRVLNFGNENDDFSDIGL